MVFQKRNNSSRDTAESKSKTERGSKRKGADASKQLKEEIKKNVEESSLSSEDLSNDTMSVNRGSDDSEGGSAGESSNSSIPYNDSANKKSNLVKIPFEPGLRLEAKDLGNEVWYAVKVVEVDWEEEEILIHFEKWSQRYDEWISMDSSRLRPIQEATAAKSTKKSSSKVFKVGDQVNATWTDSRKYPATVKAVLAGDKYDVLFLDGYSKVIKGSRIAKYKKNEANTEEHDPGKLGIFKVPEKPLAPPVLSPLITDAEIIGTKAERRERKRKLNVAELFHVKKRAKKSPPPGRKASDGGSMDEKTHRLDQADSEHKGKKEQSGEMPDVDMKSISSETDIDSKPDVSKNTDQKPATEENSEENEGKPRRKITPKVRAEDEEEIKPRRKRNNSKTSEGVTVGKGGPGRRKMTHKDDKGTGETSSSQNDGAVAGNSQDLSTMDTPKPKKSREDGEKPMSRKSALENWEPEGEPAYIVESADGLRKSIIVADNRLPEGWIKHMIQRKGGHSAGKWDVFFVCPQGRKFRSRHELRNYFEERGEEFPREQFDFSLGRRKMKWRDSSKNISPPAQGPSGIGKLPITPTTGDQVVRRVKTLLPKVRLPQSDDGSSPGSEGPRSPLPPYTSGVASMGAEDGSDGAVLVGSLKIQMENDAYICPKEGCCKHFRKENLLQMHLKHYHPEYNKFVGSTPNVADLAYARTIGEPVEDLLPKSRYSLASPMFLDKINRFEATRKSKSMGCTQSSSATLSSFSGGTSTAPDIIPYDRRKLQGKDGRPGQLIGPKKVFKGELENMSSEDSTSLPERPGEPPPVLEPAVIKDEQQHQQSTIKTLLPVVRPPPELTLVERLKMRCPTEDAVGDALLGKDQPPDLSLQQIPSTSQQPPVLQPQIASTSQSSGPPSLTKSMRTVKRKHMSDFHMEPLMRKRKSVKPPELLPEDAEFTEDGTLLSYGKKKLPVVHLEKLATTTDSNACIEGEDNSKSPQPDSAKTRVEQLRREEIINCICGYNEEDGLMIQCDLCLCWQHGLCSKIEKEEEVPEKYVCPICLNPHRERKSKHYMHDQDWLKEGKLPSFPFRSKNPETIKQREMILKRTNELVAILHQLSSVLHSLKVKCNVARAKDHPKLYLWARSWQHQDSRNELIKQAVYRFLRPRMEQLKPHLPLIQDLYEPSTSQAHMSEPIPGEKKLYEESMQGIKEEEDSKEDKDALFSSEDLSDLMLPSDMEEEDSTEPFPPPMSEDEFTSLIPSEGGCARATPLVRREKRPPDQHSPDKSETACEVSPETSTENANISIGSTENYELHTDEAKTSVGASKTPELSPDKAEATVGSLENGRPSTYITETAVSSTENAGPSADDEEMAACSMENVGSSKDDAERMEIVDTSHDAEMTVEKAGPSTDPEKTACSKENVAPLTDDVEMAQCSVENVAPSTDNGEMTVGSTENARSSTDNVEMTACCMENIGSSMNDGENNGPNLDDPKMNEVCNAETMSGNAETSSSSNLNAETTIDVTKTIGSTETTKSPVSTTGNGGPTENYIVKDKENKASEVRQAREKSQPEKEIKMAVGITELQEEIVATTEDVFEPMEEIVGNVEEIVGLPELATEEEVVETHEESVEDTSSISAGDSMPSVEEGGDFSMPPPPPPVGGNILHKALTNKPAAAKMVDLRKMRLRQILAAKVQQAFKKRAPPVPEPLIDSNECKLRLLDHVDHYHQQIEERLTTIEAQLAGLESMDPHSVTDEKPEYCPRTKQTILMLLRDLTTMQRLASY